LSQMMERLPFTLFVAAVHKQKHLARFMSAADDPYDLALKITMDRLLHFLESSGEVQLPIVAEARGKVEDNSLREAFLGIFSKGAFTSTAEKFNKLDCALVFQAKLKNIAGTQIADL